MCEQVWRRGVSGDGHPAFRECYAEAVFVNIAFRAAVRQDAVRAMSREIARRYFFR